MKQKVTLLLLTKLKAGKKKFNAEFKIIKPNGKVSIKNIKFGAKGMSDYTIHKDRERRDRYISRHKKDLRTNDPTRAGYLSMYLLWNKPSFKTSLADYKRRLNTYNKTGNFPIAIKGSPLTNSKSNKLKNGFGSSFDKLPHDIKLKFLDPITNLLMALSRPEGDDPDTYHYDWDLRNDDTVEWLNLVNMFISKTNIEEIKQYNNIHNFICKYIISYCNLKNNLNIYSNGTFGENWKNNINDSTILLKNIINKTDIIPKLTNYNQICSKNVLNFFNVLQNKTDDLLLLSEYNEYNWEITNTLTFQWLNIANIILQKQSDFNVSTKDFISNIIIDICERIDNGINISSIDKRTLKLVNIVNRSGITQKIKNINQLCSQHILEYFDIVSPDSSNQFGASSVPDNVINKSLYQKIKNKIRHDVNKKGRRWGAYDSGRLVREYKEAGGKYSRSKKSKISSKTASNLNRWYQEKWIDACVWPKIKSCGRTKTSIKSKVTYCRPSKIINSNTPKTVQELTKAQIKNRCKRKSNNPKKIIK